MDRPVIKGGTRIAVVGPEDIPSILLQRVARIQPLPLLNREFALNLLSGIGFSDYLAPIFTGISVPHISPEQIGSFRIALPPVHEQNAILLALNESTAAIEDAIASARRELVLLEEFRASLVTAVVTGKFEVLASAAALPEIIAPEAIETLEDDEDLDESTDSLETEEVAA